MNHRRPIAHFRLLTLVVLALSACAAPATPVPTASPSPQPAAPATPVPTAAPSPQPAAPPGDTPAPDPAARTAILAAMDQLKTKAWRYQGDTVMADGTTHHTLLEYAPPDRYHIVSDATTELILIGEKVYLKQGDAWTVADIPAATIIDPGASAKLAATIAGARFVAIDTLNGKPVRVYEYQSTITIGDAESTNQTKLWVGDADNLPYKLIVDGQTAAVDASTGKAVGVKSVSTIVYEYDAAISIAAPVP